MESITWEISGMHCDGCSSRLEKVLSGKDGVESASVSFSDKQAVLEYDASKISTSDLQQSIEKAGFEVTN